MSYNERMRQVSQFASTDETRINLNYCVHDPNIKALVATDGHRAIFNRSLYREQGDAFRAVTYLKTGDLVKPDWPSFKYPNIKMFYPGLTKYGCEIEWIIPWWIAKLTGRKACQIYLTAQGQVSLTKPDGESICLDAKLLKPLVDQSVKFKFKIVKDKDGAITGIDNCAPIYFKLDKDCDGVIMPMRG